MSGRKKPKPVKCVIAFFSADEAMLMKTEQLLIKKYGAFDYKSPVIEFSETSYYENEMGPGLKMIIVSFARCIKRSALPAVKRFCWRLEDKYSDHKGKRHVNIDPGLLSMENFILATGKPYSHRIYLKKGVWADLTLIYEKKKGFTGLPWTYPNYRGDTVKEHLASIRTLYQRQLKDGL